MTRHRIAFGILLADLVATAALFSRLPGRVPIHWGLDGEANGFGSRVELALLAPALLALLWALLAGLDRIDPIASRPLDPDAPPAERGAFASLTLSLMALGAIAHVGLLLQLAGLARLQAFGALFGPLILVVIGNFLPRVRPNYFAGMRTPWTLASATVWRRTNRLAGKLFFWGGLACAGRAFAPGRISGMALLGVALVASLAPVVASYVWWREEQRATRS